MRAIGWTAALALNFALWTGIAYATAYNPGCSAEPAYSLSVAR